MLGADPASCVLNERILWSGVQTSHRSVRVPRLWRAEPPGSSGARLQGTSPQGRPSLRVFGVRGFICNHQKACHLPPDFSELHLEVSFLFYVLYVLKIYMFASVCYCLPLYHSPVAGFCSLSVKRLPSPVHLVVTTVKTGQRPRGSRRRSWMAGPTRRWWTSMTTWMTFGMTGQTPRSIKLFCTCVREGVH